ncbi:MAG TPA: biotin/lipoyl-containing protein [Acidobacteriaceae bacterium]|jgi:methylmalonyl-CoA carboxyltransferase small subunit
MKLKITVDNKNYEVDVEVAESETTGHARLHAVESAAVRTPASGAAAPAPVDTTPVVESKVCRSPVSGIVANVTAQPGQTLQIGDVLLVLEAMKMETQVTAPVSGKVATIKVKAGESVQSGQILVEFE